MRLLGLYLCLLGTLLSSVGCRTALLGETLLLPEFEKYSEDDQLEFLEDLAVEVSVALGEYTASRKRLYRYTQRLKEIFRNSENPMVRAQALHILSLLLGAQGERYYLEGLRDTAFVVQYRALVNLRHYGSLQSLVPLQKALDDLLYPICRRMAGENLLYLLRTAQLSSSQRKALIRKCISLWEKEESLAVQHILYQILSKLTSQPLPFYWEDWHEWFKKNYRNEEES